MKTFSMQKTLWNYPRWVDQGERLMVPVIFNLNIDLIYELLTLLEGGLATKQVNTNKPLELLSWTIVSTDSLLKKN